MRRLSLSFQPRNVIFKGFFLWHTHCGKGGKAMNKKLFWLVTLLLLAAGTFADAQQGKIYRVGVLAQPGKAEERLEIMGLRAGLAEAGYVEGKNLPMNIPNVKTKTNFAPSLKTTWKGKWMSSLPTAARQQKLILKSGSRSKSYIVCSRDVDGGFIWSNETRCLFP